MPSAAWKDLERHAAEMLGGRRVTEHWTLFRKRPDAVADWNGRRLIIDCKRHKRHGHHRHLEKIQAEYCAQASDVPVLITREPGGAAYCTLPLDVAARLVSDSRRLHELRGEDAPEHVASILDRMAS